MPDQSHFYITTTLPYVNSTPHVGFAMELVRADVVARYQQLLGCEVFFNTGTDEHGAKIHEKALEQGMETQVYVDQAAEAFRELIELLNISPDVHFIRTTDQHHVQAAQEFWRRCQGDIYKGVYQIKYCVGCELEKTDSDLDENGRCPEHPNRQLEVREEENYFFRFSAYAKRLLEFYEQRSDFVLPDFRQEEIKKFVERGLEDFSVSRLKSKMPWGIEVPDDPDHVMYVWFDALVNYISTLGWPETAPSQTDGWASDPKDVLSPETAPQDGDLNSTFQRFWVNGTPTQYAGKDNLRQQAAMWQAMLMSAGLPNSHRIVINGHIISGGRKMSKSLGNVISPDELVDRYGVDALRYYLIRELSPFEDSDMTAERFHETYTANLVNGLGNLVSRIMKMAETHLDQAPETPTDPLPSNFQEAMAEFNLQAAADIIWERIGRLDERITETEPFKLVKTDPEQARTIIQELVGELSVIGRMLAPIMPATAATIAEAVKDNTKPETLFPRL